VVLAAALTSQAAHTKARLILDHQSVRPGDSLTAGIHLTMDADWHTYWVNSGASGMPTAVEWELPKGIMAGPIQWPIPEKLPEEDLTTYIYRNEVVLLVPLKIDATAPAGKVLLKGNVSWLECKVSCIPGSADVSSELNIGPDRSPSAEQALTAKWREELPKPGVSLSTVAWWDGPVAGDTRPLILQWTASSNAGAPDFYPYASEEFEVQGPTSVLGFDDGKVRIRKLVKRLEGDWPARVNGVVVQAGTGRIGHEVAVDISQSPPADALSRTAGSAAGQPVSLLLIFVYALIGGLILNIMPCVLPVIALKILGFVNQARDDPGRVRKLGLIYTGGVLVSFLALAAMVIAVKAAGHKAGWGMQFGNAQFLVVLIVLVTLVALNLFGLFEVTFGARVMGAAGSLASKHGAAGAFFNGVLATVLATPCTAPFLGAALGFAFAQGPGLIVAIFLTVGLGLALPYLLLSWEPRWLKFLPKPGPWMERLKIAMGFPMLATAIWLFSLIPTHYGDRSWWLGLFLVFLALAAWLFGEFVQRGAARKGLAIALAAAVLLFGYVTIVEGKLRWRSPDRGTGTYAGLAPESAPGGITWQPWSQEAVRAARATGRPVLVDFTAKWCLTCNTVVKPALESQSVRNKLAAVNALAFFGDYTRFPPAITEELNRFGRAGVPLVLVYPKNPSEPPFVLPEALTPGMVVQALEKAAQ
jgi:thiol:disulfide interchange protein DsbD